MKLNSSEITLGDELNPSDTLYIYIEDSYNCTGQSTSIPRGEALAMIEHLEEVFKFTHAEMHWKTELEE